MAYALAGMYAADVYGVEPKDLVGKYVSTGSYSDGKKFNGTAEITFEKGKTVKITWQYAKRKDIGLGRLQRNKLSVTYTRAVANVQGKAEYTVQKDGTLVGTFEDTKGKSGTETLTPQK